jgi:hypothetical protein
MIYILETISWLEPELRTLHESANVNLRLHCTGLVPDSDVTSCESSPVSSGGEPTEKEIEKFCISASLEKDIEKASAKQVRPVCLAHSSSRSPLIPGRPHIPLILSDMTCCMGRYDRICVGACGPRSMLDTTRNAAAAANFDLHVDPYEW